MAKYELDYSKAVFRCPECQGTEGLWEGFHAYGWLAVKVGVGDNNKPVIHRDGFRGSPGMDWDIDPAAVTNGPNGGCGDCGWEGLLSKLELYAPKKIGWDGRPIRAPFEGQLELTEL
jgi:hypothetical protein